MSKYAILFYGPPGAGKGTQAEKVAKKYNYFHFDTGKFIESLIHNPVLRKKAIIRKQKDLFLSGKLADPKWVGTEVKKRIKEISLNNQSLIMSGSPRTEEEAFYLKGGGVIDTLIKYYGKDNILIFFLNIPVTESIKRNSKRGRPGLDEPNIIKIRCREYAKRTLPIIKEIKKRNIKVIRLDGSFTKSIITKNIFVIIKEFLKCPTSNLRKTLLLLKNQGKS